MEVRRALLLFAIVLGLAAIATSLSQPAPERRTETDPAPVRPEGSLPRAGARPPAPQLPEVGFSAGRGEPPTKSLLVGRAVTVTVEVREPGQVELVGLGLSNAADPRTPARFDVLATSPARHAVRFRPASGDPPRVLGILAVRVRGSRPRRREKLDAAPQPRRSSTAALISATGAGRSVHTSRLRAPWRTSTSMPSTTLAPPARAHFAAGVSVMP